MKRLIIFALTLFSFSYMWGQTPTVGETKIVFNSTTGNYEVWVKFNQNGPVSIGTSQISLILPGTYTNITDIAVTPVNGGGWNDNNRSFDVSGKDYYSFVTTGQGNMPYGTVGTELLLFTFQMPGLVCVPNLRLWTAGTDVDQTPDGTDYISYFYTTGNATDLQTSNYGANPAPCPGPTANDDTATTSVGVATTINVLANDTNTDGTAADLSKSTLPTIVTPPAHGTLVINASGSITYTPTAGYNGADTFTYQICDALNPLICETATVSLTVGCNAGCGGTVVAKN